MFGLTDRASIPTAGVLIGQIHASAVEDHVAAAVLMNLLCGVEDIAPNRVAAGAVEGLELDCGEATAESLVSHGPEALCREIIAAIKSECSLTEAERKN